MKILKQLEAIIEKEGLNESELSAKRVLDCR